MAQIKPRKGADGTTRYTAVVRYRGVDASRTFSARRDAERWGSRVEDAIDAGSYDPAAYGVRMRGERREQVEAAAMRAGTAPAPDRGPTVADLCDRYEKEVTAGKAADTMRRELRRIDLIRKSSLGPLPAADIAFSDVDAWVETRMDEADGNTVRKDLGLIGSLYRTALKNADWRRTYGRWINRHPLAGYVRPEGGSERTRVLTDDDESKLRDACAAGQCGWPWMPQALSLALETAMRQGELVSARWSQYNAATRTIHLPKTKNGDARTVPLSSAAVAALAELPQHGPDDHILPDLAPDTRGMSLRGYFRRLCEAAGVRDLVWHDLRHTAVTRLFQRTQLRDMEIMSISGHRSVAMLRRYTHIRTADLVHKLG